MRQHGVVGRAAAGAAAFEQRGMEPAAMLVRAFEIELGRPCEIGIAFEHEDVGRARFEPDVDDVRHLLVIGRVVACCRGSARAGSRTRHRRPPARRPRDALDHRGIAQRLARLLVDEDRDRHAPGALARDAPVRPVSRSWQEAVVAGAGTKRVSSIAASAFSRSSFVSMEMNHCGVLRKMTGALERQEWG